MKIATATFVGPCQHKPASERCVTCVLDASDYFSGLGLDAKRALQQVLTYRSFERRETLYAEGAASHHLYILISGKVKVYKSLSNGRQQIHKLGLAPGDLLLLYTDGLTDVRWDGQVLGEERLLALVTSLGDVEAAEFPEALFARVMERAGGGLSDDVAILAVSLGE